MIIHEYKSSYVSRSVFLVPHWYMYKHRSHGKQSMSHKHMDSINMDLKVFMK